MTEFKDRSLLVDALLAEHGTPHGDGRAALHPCEGTKFHSPAPLTTYCYEPYEGRQIWLCPTCLSKLECYLHLDKLAPQDMSWNVKREFGNQIRMFGQEIADRRGPGNTAVLGG